MKRLIATFNDKGGVGKSILARVLAELLIAQGSQPLLVDADATVGHLLGYLGVRDADGWPTVPQPPEGVRTYALHGSADDRVEFGSILEEDRDLILVDLPAASATMMRQVEADYGLFALAHSKGYAVTLIVSITPDASSMFAVSDAAEVDPLATIVVVKNLGFGEPHHFIVWDGSEKEHVEPASGKAIVAVRGFEISIPKLDPATVALIGAHRLTFAHAASPASSPLILPRRSQVGTWLTKVRTEFGKAGDALGIIAQAQVTE